MFHPSPRLLGVQEHLERVQILFDLSVKEQKLKGYRLMLTAIYSCRAMTKLMLEAAEKQEIKQLKNQKPKINRDAYEAQIVSALPYYYLIERIRIHDFHRFGIAPPNPNQKTMFLGGPVKLKAQKGMASISLANQGLQVQTSGMSQIQTQRPLLIQDGLFFDEDSHNYVAIKNILETFLEKAPCIISQFANDLE